MRVHFKYWSVGVGIMTVLRPWPFRIIVPLLYPPSGCLNELDVVLIQIRHKSLIPGFGIHQQDLLSATPQLLLVAILVFQIPSTA